MIKVILNIDLVKMQNHLDAVAQKQAVRKLIKQEPVSEWKEQEQEAIRQYYKAKRKGKG